jgi:2-C-methyl-D-erythritol 4-phosphate cytidylyltransferase / 2-C-methyl-D-erythritol 2,4-cyclodiphosphate synthase
MPETPKQQVAALIVAAGRGSRLGGDVPKQYRRLAGMAVLAHTIRAFDQHPEISTILVVIHPDDAALYAEAIKPVTSAKLLAHCAGGATRQASVRAGLDALTRMNPDIVLIHDAARPFVSATLISNAVQSAATFGAAVPGAEITDTVVRVDGGLHAETLSRDALRRVQTPQAFRFGLIRDAHQRLVGNDSFTDDGGVAAACDHAIHVFAGDAANTKITTAKDLEDAELRMTSQSALISRTGQGFDVHAFKPGDHIWLCGVKIPHTQAFEAHSDGDVALHALTDALFGAMADGDIGRHFPPSDPRWKGAASDQFLAYAVNRLRTRGGRIDLMDVTIICEAPKIGPHAEAMRARIAEIAGIPVSAVSVKATTTERLGFTGRKEGIAAMASVTVRLPE